MESFSLSRAAAAIGITSDSLKRAVARGSVSFTWATLPSGQRIRVFTEADIEAYKQRRISRLTGELAKAEARG